MMLFVFIALLINNLCGTDAGTGPHAPVFRGVPTTVRTSQSDTVLLPCYVENLGQNTVRWWWENNIIADSSEPQMLSPLRIKMFPNHTLQVSDLRKEDTGEYKCEVVRPSPWGSIFQVHAIQVFYPPTVDRIPSSGRLEVQLGLEVDMTCIAQGVPPPIITWFAKGREMQLIDNRPRLRFIAEDRRQSGMYQCVANNGIGIPATTTVLLRVLYPPEVHAEETWVHTGIGVRSELICHVLADPVAQVEWLLEGEPLKYIPRIVPIEEHGVAKLLFRHVERRDPGFYTCRATNHVGTGQSIIELSGVAKEAEFKTDVNFYSEHNFTLVWEVDSYSSIIEYELLFRKYGPRPDSLSTALPWNSVIVPADSHTPGPIHSKVFSLTGLKRATEYEIVVQSRNLFGWSKPSAILRISTAGSQVDEHELSEDDSDQTNTIPDKPGFAFISEDRFYTSHSTINTSTCHVLCASIFFWLSTYLLR